MSAKAHGSLYRRSSRPSKQQRSRASCGGGAANKETATASDAACLRELRVSGQPADFGRPLTDVHLGHPGGVLRLKA